MNSKALCLFIFLISILALSSKAEAFEDTTSSVALSPSTIFSPDSYSDLSPRSNIGKMLIDNGFQQESMKEEKEGFQVYDPGAGIDQSYPSYEKTFKKDGYTVRYRYAFYVNYTGKQNLAFDWVEITFPSKSAMNGFLDSLKASIKRKGNKIFSTPENPNWYYIGDDDSDMKNGIVWSYDKYWIKGNTVTFHETKGMSPNEYFLGE